MQNAKKERVASNAGTMVIIACIVACLHLSSVSATPLNNVFDPQPFYTVYGTDKYYNASNKADFSFFVSPFYQSARTVRGEEGQIGAMPAGARLGKWNMLGVFFGQAAAPQPFADYEHLPTLQNNISTMAIGPQPPASSTTPTPPAGTIDKYQGLPPLNMGQGADYTKQKNFRPEYEPFVFLNVPVRYEKIGVRVQTSIELYGTFGATVKAGFVNVRQNIAPSKQPSIAPNNTNPPPVQPITPLVQSLTPQFAYDAIGMLINGNYIVPGGTPATTPPTTTPLLPQGPDDTGDAAILYDNLVSESALRLIAEDIGLDFAPYNKSVTEDVHASVHCHMPIEFRDKNNDLAVTVAPYIEVGCWIPTRNDCDADKLFYVSTGNDGYYGLTVEGSVAFDFPLLPKSNQTFQGCFGGGCLYAFQCKEFQEHRVHSSPYQSGFIPWKTSIRKQPGITWYMNVSGKSNNFVDGLSVYADWIYTVHLKDHITLTESNPERKAAFEEGLPRTIRESSWKNQQAAVGFDYRLSPAVTLGGAVQANLSGIRIYRSVTLLGSIMVTF